MSKRYLSAREACRELSVKPQTLYAYVSRGLVRSEEGSEGRRSRRYHGEDIARLKRRRELKADPERMAEGALRAGEPVLESSLTLIEDDQVYYRGMGVDVLATQYTAEDVASLLWTGDIETEIPELTESSRMPDNLIKWMKTLGDLSMIEKAQVALPVAAESDPHSVDLSPRSVIRSGARILRLLTAIASGRYRCRGTIAETLKSVWAPKDDRALQIINAALILCADHELNVSSFTARCVASSGASIYAVVNAGLCALQGHLHGGASRRVESFWREVEADSARQVVVERLRRGEPLHGFGHILYQGEDPRAKLLMELVSSAYEKSSALSTAQDIIRAVKASTDLHYNVDLAMVAMRHALSLPSGVPQTVFALGRTIGWIAHAIEQYGGGTLIRPRARYTGPSPEFM